MTGSHCGPEVGFGEISINVSPSPFLDREDDPLKGSRITSALPTIQPELMDACLDWMACSGYRDIDSAKSAPRPSIKTLRAVCERKTAA